MKHLILTRACYEDAELSRRRLELSKATAIPAVASQTADVEWWVRLKAADPLLYERKKAFESCGHTVVFFSDGFQTCGKDYGWHLQTRLDDDDAISMDYCQRIQEAALDTTTARRWFTFPKGVRVIRNRYCGMTNPGNQFITLMNHGNSGRHVYDIVHGHVLKEGEPIHRLGDEISWLWTRHADAKSDGGYVSVRNPITDKLKARFNVDWQRIAELTGHKSPSIAGAAT